MILRGPGSKLSDIYPQSDVAVYDFLGKEGEKIIPGYRYLIGYKDMYTTHGDFDEFMYSCLGIYGFVGELFMSSQERYRKPGEGKEPAEEERRSYYGGTPPEEKQKFNDIVNQGRMFRNWERYDHPQFGEVEIGGWRTFTTRIPPLYMLPELLHRNASLVIFTARHAPVVSLETVDVKELGDGLHRVRVRVSNPNAIPSLSSRAVQKGIARPDILRIEGKRIEVVSGAIVEDPLLERMRPVEHRPSMIFTHVPSFGARMVQWIVRGKGEIKVTYDSVKAKNRTLKLKL
jgi:hypothetical protein